MFIILNTHCVMNWKCVLAFNGKYATNLTEVLLTGIDDKIEIDNR